ncbi:MAG: response regulator [Planctomycetota bacterium]|nr:response regulator [Planctomycetota bacterium]
MVRNVSVLLVDDEADIRTLLREIVLEELDGETCSILEAKDGQEAIDLIREQAVDIIMTDMKMPRMDGLTLLKEAKKLLPDVEMIVMTGYSEDYTREEALRLGARDYITKPFEVDEVRLILMKACLKVEGRRDSRP